jgi:hypothetical protein
MSGLSLSKGFFYSNCGWKGCFGWSYENFLVIEVGCGSLLLLKLIVDLLIRGWYFGETDPAPNEEDKTLDFAYFASFGGCP